MPNAKKQIEPFLPYLKVYRNSAPLAASLAPAIGVTYQHARGALVLFWEALADRRWLAQHLERRAIVLTADDLRARLRLAFGQDVAPEILAVAGFLEALPDGWWRVRGGSNILEVESERIAKINRARKPVTPPSTPPATPPEERGERKEERVGKEDLGELFEPAAAAEKPRATKTKRQPSEWESVWATCETYRREGCERAGVPYEPQELKPARVNHLLARAVEVLNELDPEGDRDAESRGVDLVLLFRRFVWSAYWRNADPPFPLEGFASEKVLRKLDELAGGPKDPTKLLEWYT